MAAPPEPGAPPARQLIYGDSLFGDYYVQPALPNETRAKVMAMLVAMLKDHPQQVTEVLTREEIARTPVPTRAAATVLLLRDSPQGLEVLMTRRSATASFAPGAYVFPGGGIDAADGEAHGHARRRPTQSDLSLTEAIAAIRESFEELGVLLARHADGRMADDGSRTATCPGGLMCLFWWHACPRGKHLWPTRPSSLTRSGCLPPMPWPSMLRGLFS
mgnify:CR=1 FL=1